MPRVTTEQMIEAVQKAHGLLGLAARMLGVGRDSLRRRIRESAALREAVHDARQYMAEVAERSLSQAMQDREELCAYLRRQCKPGQAVSGPVDPKPEVQIDQPITEQDRLAEVEEILEAARAREAAARLQSGGAHRPSDA